MSGNRKTMNMSYLYDLGARYRDCSDPNQLLSKGGLLGSWKRFTNSFQTQKVDIFSFLYFHPTIWLVCFCADVSKTPNCSCDLGFVKQNINTVISCLELQHPGIFSRRHIFRPSSTLQTEAGSFPPTTHTSRITPDQQPFPTSLATEGQSA